MEKRGLDVVHFFVLTSASKVVSSIKHSGIIHTFSDMLKVEGIVNPINAQIRIEKQCNKPYLDLRQ